MSVSLQGEGIMGRLATLVAWALAAACLATLVGAVTDRAEAGPRETYVSHSEGRLIPIPKDILHQPGSYIDRRLIANIRFLDQRFGPLYITEGYAGPLRGRGTIGCPDCHVSNSDHFTGLALDIAAPSGSTACDRSWRRISALAKWAEPRQNIVRRPFRWVGYDGDAGHGCGNHLHLSWNSAPARSFHLASWVELFKVRSMSVGDGHVSFRPSGGSEVLIGDDRAEPTGGISPR
jgi:hypothetical protein